MAYEMVMPYHLHMPSYFLETFTEYPYFIIRIHLYFKDTSLYFPPFHSYTTGSFLMYTTNFSRSVFAR